MLSMGEAQPYAIEIYIARTGSVPFEEWLLRLRDARTRARIRARLARVRLGNFGDAHAVGGGVWELRIDYGPGYRVYYTQSGPAISSCFVVEIRLPRLQISGRQRRLGPSTRRGGSMSRLTKNYRESLLQALQDSQEAAEYLTAVLEEGDRATFLLA